MLKVNPKLLTEQFFPEPIRRALFRYLEYSTLGLADVTVYKVILFHFNACATLDHDYIFLSKMYRAHVSTRTRGSP